MLSQQPSQDIVPLNQKKITRDCRFVVLQPGGNMQVQSMLGHFDHLMTLVAHKFQVECLAPRIFVIQPKTTGQWNGSMDKPIALSLVGLIHGVEVGGLGVLCSLLELLIRDGIDLKISLGIAIGNSAAAQKSVRFVERDLNRSFGREAANLLEEKRADELELMLLRSRYFIDFHQVKLPVTSPFWIFPYTPDGFALARAIGPDVPLITHWGKGFSADGQCSDEFVNRNGGAGTTIELGQNSFEPRQIGLGVQIALQGIAFVSERLAGGFPMSRTVAATAPIYTWGQVIPYPETGAPVLDEGWNNFMPVKKGQRLGEFAGQEIQAAIDGLILFPKYPDPPQDGQYPKTPPAAELVRILKQIDDSELPH